MQIFRVSPDHEISARYMDNRRLSKQVLELYQIIRVCLAALDIIDSNTRYLHHPIVKHVYNDGYPYVIDTFNMLVAMDIEHRRRGGKRSPQFKEDIIKLEAIILEHKAKFSHDPLPGIYVYGEDKFFGDATFDMYVQLLHDKWANDTIAPRCSVKLTQELR